jgi:hypothetical protein
MIERTTGKLSTWAGDPGRFGGPGADERLQGVLAEVDRVGVLSEARTGVALEALASGRARR